MIWATGFAVDYSWLHVDAFEDTGRPRHQRGISPEPGVYFIGLPWLTRRSSSFLCGVSGDAPYLADHIAVERNFSSSEPDESVDVRLAT